MCSTYLLGLPYLVDVFVVSLSLYMSVPLSVYKRPKSDSVYFFLKYTTLTFV